MRVFRFATGKLQRLYYESEGLEVRDCRGDRETGGDFGV